MHLLKNKLITKSLESIIKDIKLPDRRERVLLQLFLLTHQDAFQELLPEIILAVWDDLDENGLPKSSNFYPNAWEDLNPSKEQYLTGIKKYLLNINFPSQIGANGRILYFSNISNSFDVYLHTLIHHSGIAKKELKISWSEDELHIVLDKLIIPQPRLKQHKNALNMRASSV